ncbi:hypothetical protein [Alkalicoccus urumqiensis]|uniref:Uncharacterized protein n=1 Tax=Alkalicoccus urumqiensis TaxID=1548213 RepID=A0A2P6MLS9_ALKUR|nr:hypothetical protein [Alkalicoccus urumqiensis]PRO67232.1 hypothetical protein C6I21_01335 [Alkalicoccus urumqiensis]
MHPILTEEELTLVSTFVTALWTKKVLERDKQRISRAGFKYSHVYEEWFDFLELQNGGVLQRVRFEMKEQGMEVWPLDAYELKSTPHIIGYGCQSRGYRTEYRLAPEVLKRKVERHLRRLLLEQKKDHRPLRSEPEENEFSSEEHGRIQ